MKVRIAEGRAIRDPVTHTLYQAGETREVPESMFWHRRLRDGDATAVRERHPQQDHERHGRAAAKGE
jgi:hypothetical protein